MTFDLQQVAGGLAIGSVYGMVALGLVLIYRSTGALNFADLYGVSGVVVGFAVRSVP